MVLYSYWHKIIGNKDDKDMKVVVVGSGNVAESLAQAVA